MEKVDKIDAEFQEIIINLKNHATIQFKVIEDETNTGDEGGELFKYLNLTKTKEEKENFNLPAEQETSDDVPKISLEEVVKGWKRELISKMAVKLQKQNQHHYNTRSKTATVKHRSPPENSKLTISSFKPRPKRKVHPEQHTLQQNPKGELLPIGPGGTLLPRSTLISVPWELHTRATHILLRAVFSRELLRTSSLTGNRNNAHPDKPAKMALDSVKVADIIHIVEQNCGVNESCIKKCITSACADEAKRPTKTLQRKTSRPSLL